MEAPAALAVARWLALASAMILFGASLFDLYAPAGACRRGLSWSAATGLALLLVCAEAAWLGLLSAQLDPAEPLTAAIGALLFETPFGPVWIARLLLAAAMLVSARIGRLRLQCLFGFLWLGAEGWNGHAAAAAGPWGALAQAIHVVCAAAWLGGLLPLYQTVRVSADVPEQDVLETLRRFSLLATGFVLTVVITGTISIWNVAELGMSAGPYAAVLGIKLSLVGLMILLAARNRFAHRPHAKRDTQTFRRIAARTLIEQVVGLLVLLDVSFLGLMSPFS